MPRQSGAPHVPVGGRAYPVFGDTASWRVCKKRIGQPIQVFLVWPKVSTVEDAKLPERMMRSFDRTLLLGLVALLAGIAALLLLGKWQLTAGWILGGVITLGLGGQLVRRAADSASRNPANRIFTVGRTTMIVSTAMAVLPAMLVGVVAAVLGSRYSAVFFAAGFFLAMAVSTLAIYAGMWAIALRGHSSATT